MHLITVVERLWVIDVDLVDRTRGDVVGQKFATTNYCESHVRQTSLIRASCGVADDDWQDVGGQVIDP